MASRSSSLRETIIPDRWLDTPPMCSSLINGMFLVFKTPLSSEYDSSVSEEKRFTPSDVVDRMNILTDGKKISAIISLVNTNRYYDPREFSDNHGIRHFKLPCVGRNKYPETSVKEKFISICSGIGESSPGSVIGVHCTHGYNRSGFLVICYLVEHSGMKLDDALLVFSRSRSRGIYKRDYIHGLRSMYASNPHNTLSRKRDANNEDDMEDREAKRRISTSASYDHKDITCESPHEFAVDVPNVFPLMCHRDEEKIEEIRRNIKQLCPETFGNGFIGSQPVSMTLRNIMNLQQLEYRVSWKADGTRFLCLIKSQNEIYMIDRRNCIFAIHNLSFLSSKSPTEHLSQTLVDGEMVTDIVDGKAVHRYLIYDVLAFNGQPAGQELDFDQRMELISREIVNPRYRAMQLGLIDRQQEPFGVRRKDFWHVMAASKILGEKFQQQLSHGIDGLIFQPVHMPYIFGTCYEVLKWKPEDMNSIDFKMIIPKSVMEKRDIGSAGYLHVRNLKKPFAKIRLTEELFNCNEKIVECICADNRWKMLRIRSDKTTANTHRTALAIAESIQNPVTKDLLLEAIKAIRPERFVIRSLNDYRQADGNAAGME
ncbi:hypothetical protein ACOME3_009513 [Neoechinorhynchus agilis]